MKAGAGGWSGGLCPVSPDTCWIDDATGDHVDAETGARHTAHGGPREVCLRCGAWCEVAGETACNACLDEEWETDGAPHGCDDCERSNGPAGACTCGGGER